MQIEDMQQSIDLLNDINCFFKNIDKVEEELKTALYNKDGERDDLLHEIELSDLNAIERQQIYAKLRKVLKERRIIKDKLVLINTIKPYANKYIMKGICGDTKIAIQNIEKLEEYQENRQYTPRVLKDLKCAKKKGE